MCFPLLYGFCELITYIICQIVWHNCVRCHFTCLQIPQNICHLTRMYRRSNLSLACIMQLLLLDANEAVFCPTDREKSHRSPTAWLSPLTGGSTMIYSLLNEVSCTVYIQGMTLLSCERKGWSERWRKIDDKAVQKRISPVTSVGQEALQLW